MKGFIVGKVIDNMNKYYNYDEEKTAEIRYGIESIYLLITKTIVIFSLAILLGIIKELVLLMIFYNLLRASGFGVHAKKSWHCWVSSSIIFLGVPMLMKYLILPNSIMFIVSAFFCLVILKYAPADTEKRPIINKKRRKIYKFCCFSTSLIFTISILFIENTVIQNSLMFSIIVESFMILPITYKIFNVKYDNYKMYNGEFQVQ